MRWKDVPSLLFAALRHRWLWALLLILVALRHHTSQVLALSLPISAPGIFYIQGGLWEALLCGVIAAFLWNQEPSFWKRAGLAAMAVGIIEGLQMSVCRSLVVSMADVPKGVNICDHVTGKPVAATLMWLEIFMVCVLLGRKNAKREPA